MISQPGFLYFHGDSRGGSTFVAGQDRRRADDRYAREFAMDGDSEANREAREALVAEDFVTAAVLYFPDGCDPKEGTDIDDEDHGFVIVPGPHAGWKTDHGMLVCTCEICPACGGWLSHTEACPRKGTPFPTDCCEVPIDRDTLHEGPLRLEYVPADRQPELFQFGWKHVRFDDDCWNLIYLVGT